MNSQGVGGVARSGWLDLPERLRRLRARRGLSQSDLAEALGVSAVTVSRWEQGHHRPAVVLWQRILRLESSEEESPAAKPMPLPVPFVPMPRFEPGAGLPFAATSFVGRERELAELQPLLAMPSASGGRLLTLTGAGGSGKSRLALELARAVADDPAGAVCIVELAPLADPADLHAFITTALDLRELPGVPLVDTITTFLRPRRFLLVLDNCEHLLGACAALVEHLLDACPGLRILTTSRQPLGATGELVRLVPPLAVPTPGASVEQAAASGAVRLFLDRARLLQPDFELDADRVGPVVQICGQLEGLPLALELAAARLHLLPVAQVTERLATSQRLLTRAGRTEQGRHQSLRAALDGSYALLSPPEQELFPRLAVFAGGFSVQAAEAVGADGGSVQKPEVLDLLEQLVERSLVVREARSGKPRLRLLEPVRQYALELLEERGELAAVRERHTRWCLALAEEAARRCHGPEEKAALDRLEVEHDNLRAAMRWAQTRGVNGLQLGAALWFFWFQRCHFSEGERYLDLVLAATPGLELSARAVALNGAAGLAWRQGNHAEVAALTSECLTLARKLGERAAMGYALHLRATATWEQGKLEEGEQMHEQSLEHFRAAGEAWGTGLSLGHLGIVHQLRGDLAGAEHYLQQALACFRASGDRSFTADTLDVVGVSLEGRGDRQRAGEHYREALRLHINVDDRTGIAIGLTRFAALAAAEGRFQRAARLFGAMDALLQTQASRLPQFYQQYADHHLAELRAKLDEERFARAWAEGQQMPLADAIELALAEDLSPASPPRGERLTEPGRLAGPLTDVAALSPGGLSRREVEVLALLAQGKSNKQIGEALTLSVRTVERHIANICLKTGVHGRAAATAYAFRHGLAGRP